MESSKKTRLFYRWLFYIVGSVFLAMGIALNTKSDLGMAPILSIMFCVSQIFDLNFSDLTMYYYVFLVVAEFIIKGKKYAHKRDLLQFPLAIIFSRFIALFSGIFDFHPVFLWQKLLILAAAIVVTGVGLTMMVNMNLVPNPGDGIVQAISERFSLKLGTAKNLFDGLSAFVSIVLSLVLEGRLIGIGLGTVLNVLCVGRVVAIFSHFCREKMLTLAFGGEKQAEAAAENAGA
jgi:uncharacterized membrane protein YczE